MPQKWLGLALTVQVAEAEQDRLRRKGSGPYPSDSLVARVTAPACLRRLRNSHCPNNGNRESGEKGKSNEIFPHGLLLSGKLRKCLERIGPKASGYFDLRGTPLDHFGDLAVYQREGLC